MENKLNIKLLESKRKDYKNILLARTSPHKDLIVNRDVLVCCGTGCESSKSEKIYNNLIEEINKNNISDKVKVIKTGCFGFCEQGPIVKIMPDKVFYVKVTPDDVKEIVDKQLVKNETVDRLLYTEQQTERNFDKEIDFYDKQMRVVLRNCGLINPEVIEEYIANDGYAALAKVLSGMTSDDVIEELKNSQLRGRGGAGFPTWMKWNNTKIVKNEKKYIVCNGDEGDPGAYMDRSILEGDPHSIIEAMTICGYTVGAQKGYFYIRAEYGLAINRVKIALKQAYEKGLLGKNILGTDFSFDIDIRLGAGAFVCGEETALLSSIEGKRGTPKPRPPYPSVKGLFGYPTIINNVETLANIPVIITRGSSWFASIGTENSKGTKVFALTGKVNISGLIEVPMGTTIREIVYDIGKGIPDNKKVKGIQTGGPSGGVIPEKFFDTKVDYESLMGLGSMMGSGGMIVIDEDDSIVDFCKFYLGFCVDESCGKCTSCRIGGTLMYKILERMEKKRGKEGDIERLYDLAFGVKNGSLCGLGQSASNPVISTLKYFREEYEDAIFKKTVKGKE